MGTGFESLDVMSRAGKKVKKGNVLRAEGFIPGVIFGNEMESVNIKIPYNEWVSFSLKNQVIFNAKVEGGDTHLVAIKQIDRDNMGRVEHLNLHKMKKGQKASVTIPVHTTGEKHKDNEGIIYHNITELSVEAIPSEVPESIEVDISEMMAGDTVLIKDLKIGKGVEIQGHDPEDSVVDCRISVTKEEPTDEETPAAESGEVEVTEVEGSDEPIKVDAKDE